MEKFHSQKGEVKGKELQKENLFVGRKKGLKLN